VEIRVGTVSSVNESEGTVKVLFPNYDDAVSHDLPIVKLGGVYALPAVGEPAVCLIYGSDLQGFYLGSYFPSAAPLLNKGETAILGNLTVNGRISATGTINGGSI